MIFVCCCCFQLRDENFEHEETKFRSVEKAVKVLLRNVMSYMDQLQVGALFWSTFMFTNVTV